MMAGVMSWRKALKFSCTIHLFALMIITAALAGWAEPAKQEHYIDVELAAPVDELSGSSQSSAMRQQTVSVPAAQDASMQAGRTAFAVPPGISPARAKTASPSSGGTFVGAGQSEATASIPQGGGENTDALAEGAGQAAADVDRAATVNGFVARVEANKKYPYMALKRSLEGRPVIHVELDAAGNLAALSLSASSGTESLDKAALTAVQNACPYRHGLGTVLAMEVPVNYQLTGG